MLGRLLHPFLVLALLSLAACGADAVGAVVGSGDVVARVGGVEGPVTERTAFGDGDALKTASGAVVRVACGGSLSASSTVDGAPGQGLADVHLEPGTELRRRAGTAFDLVTGSLRLHAGPLKSRIVLFRGTTFLEIPTTNTSGVDLLAAAEGDVLTVTVRRGDVLLHSTGATQSELHFVKLGPGESAAAAPGAEPERQDAAD